MDIESVFSVLNAGFRRRRFQLFQETIQPTTSDTILDVGGRPGTWTPNPGCASRIDILNVEFDPDSLGAATEADPGHIHRVMGDARDLSYADGEYDIVFSNSVIEHVGTWEDQQTFAAEARRVGRRLWVQTPARSFPVEPHYIAPFVHWLPPSVQRRLVGWATPWGWIERPSREKVARIVEEIRLLNHGEMKELFPDCEILKERSLGIFTKSYIAVRTAV